MVNLEVNKYDDIECGTEKLLSLEKLNFLYYGKDLDNKFFIQFKTNIDFGVPTSTRIIKVNAFAKKTEKNIKILRFTLEQNEYVENFVSFVNGMIIKIFNIENMTAAIKAIFKYYNGYLRFFSKINSKLIESQIMGLIGELLFLKSISNEKGIEYVINSWTGTDMLHKDFSFEKTWYEIKTINSSKHSVQINSIEQLCSVDDGHLVVFKLEKMSKNFDGISLNKLVNEISDSLDEETLEKFNEKLSSVGYCYFVEYDDFVYDLKEKISFLVDKNFPRLNKDEIASEIFNAKYEIEISNLEREKENE